MPAPADRAAPFAALPSASDNPPGRPRIRLSASRVCDSSSGLERIITTESARTGLPGWIMIRSMRPAVCAGITIVSSGTSVPIPLTSSTIGPRRTVPGQRVDPGTPGAAGFNLPSATVVPPITPAIITTATVHRMAFFLPTFLRCMSIWIPGLRKGTAPANCGFGVTL